MPMVPKSINDFRLFCSINSHIEMECEINVRPPCGRPLSVKGQAQRPAPTNEISIAIVHSILIQEKLTFGNSFSLLSSNSKKGSFLK